MGLCTFSDLLTPDDLNVCLLTSEGREREKQSIPLAHAMLKTELRISSFRVQCLVFTTAVYNGETKEVHLGLMAITQTRTMPPPLLSYSSVVPG